MKNKSFNNSFTIWFTGLTGSGKSTLAQMLYETLLSRYLKVELLDSDIIRKHISNELGFVKQDRETHLWRIAFICKLLSKHDVICIVAAVSPYRETREKIKRYLKKFVEVYVKCPIDVLIKRDVNGFYQKVLAGEIKNVAGFDCPYEEPLQPDIIVETHKETPKESLKKIITTLTSKGLI